MIHQTSKQSLPSKADPSASYLQLLSAKAIEKVHLKQLQKNSSKQGSLGTGSNSNVELSAAESDNQVLFQNPTEIELIEIKRTRPAPRAALFGIEEQKQRQKKHLEDVRLAKSKENEHLGPLEKKETVEGKKNNHKAYSHISTIQEFYKVPS